MKATIITATRNDAPTIRSTMLSVLEQSHADIDYIVVDGMSTDGASDIIDSISLTDHRVRVVHERDNGVYQAINKGITLSEGEIVGTLHGNDRFTGGDVLAKVVEAFEENSDIDVVFGDVHFENKKGTIVRQYSSADFTPEKLLIGIAPPHPSLYVRRSVFDRFGFYKEDYLIGADFDMFLRLLYVNKVGYLRLGIDMVAMSLGGLSTQLFHRIVTNNREKYRALRENGVNVSRFALLKRYFYR
ncbi:MAG: glycosyltransferase [Muribaculaceae bacterium]|nr:glycosyltransferase [Muribaculaceae bacterium]